MAERRKRWITADFFEVKCGSGDQDGECFGKILNELHSTRQTVGERTVQVFSDLHRIHDWRFDGTVGTGAFLRLRQGHAPMVASIDNEDLRDLDLRAGEVLTEYFCFAYFHRFRTLVVHRNRDAGGSTRLATYAQHLQQTPIHFNAFMTKDGMKRIGQMRDITVAELGLSVPENKGLMEQNHSTAMEMINLINKSGAQTLSLRLSMGRSKEPMLVFVRDWWSQIVRTFGSEIVTKARVFGTLESDSAADDGAALMLDLLDVNMKEVIPIEGEVAPTMSDIHTALKDVYARRESDIQVQFTASRL